MNLRIMNKQFCASKLLNRIKEKEKGPSSLSGKKDIKVIFKTMDFLYLLLKAYLQSEVYHLYELLLLQLFWLHRCYYPQEYADFQHLQQC